MDRPEGDHNKSKKGPKEKNEEVDKPEEDPSPKQHTVVQSH